MKKVLLKIKKKLPVMFALILAIMCMIAPAFASSTTGSGYLFNQVGTYSPDDDCVYFLDESGFVPELGVQYLITLNGKTYNVEPVEVGYNADVGEVCWLFEFGPYSFGYGMLGHYLESSVGGLDSEDHYTLTVSIVRDLGDILSDSGDVVTSITSWVGSVARMVINEPIMLIGFTIALAGLAFGIFKGLKR